MALTRKLLKEMGIQEDKIEEIISAHSETVEALKGFKADAQRLSDVENELEAARAELSLDFRSKYEALLSDFDSYKQNAAKESAAKDLHRQKESEFERLLRDCKVHESCIKPILRVFDVDSLELTDEGKLSDSESVSAMVARDWSAFIQKSYTEGAVIPNPPQNIPQRAYSADDIRKMSYSEINRNYQEIKKSLNGEEL